MISPKRMLLGLVVAFALVQSAAANTWAQLPFYSETSLFDLGDGLSELGDKAGKCLKPTSRSALTSSTTDFALRVEDEQAKRLESTTRTNQLSVEAGGSFGVGGANAKYSRSTTTTNERTKDDRKLYVVLDASATLSSESSYDYALSENGSAFLKKSQSEFIENCGAMVAVELTRAIRIRAVIEITFSSSTAKSTFSEKLGFSADGQYGAFSASVSSAQQLDKILSTANDKIALAADVRIRSDSGVQGLGELSQQLSQTRADPFKHALEAVSALLKARATDKGSINKIRFVPVERVVPSLNLLPWSVRERFWMRASAFYEGILGLEEVNALTALARAPWQARSTRGYIAEALLDDICKRGMVDGIGRSPKNVLIGYSVQCNPEMIALSAHEKLIHIKDRIRWLMIRCLAAERSERVYCSDESIVTFAQPVFKKYFYAETRFRSLPDEFSPKDYPDAEPTGETPVELWSEDQKIQVAERSFTHWLSMITQEREYWTVENFQKANAVWVCCSVISAHEIDEFSRDVDSYLNYLYEHKIGLFAYDAKIGMPTDIGLGHQSVDANVWLHASGYFYPEAIEVVTSSGAKITYEFKSKRFARHGESLLFWYGDTATCQSSCEPKSPQVLKMVQAARDVSVSIYLRAETLGGSVYKHIKTIRAR